MVILCMYGSVCALFWLCASLDVYHIFPVFPFGTQSSFPLQQYWGDSDMYSTLVLVWYIPYAARGQQSLLNVMKI